jgi:hypothetical protein
LCGEAGLAPARCKAGCKAAAARRRRRGGASRRHARWDVRDRARRLADNSSPSNANHAAPGPRGPRSRAVNTVRCALRAENCAKSAPDPFRRYITLMCTQYNTRKPVKVAIHAEK